MARKGPRVGRTVQKRGALYRDGAQPVDLCEYDRRRRPDKRSCRDDFQIRDRKTTNLPPDFRKSCCWRMISSRKFHGNIST